MHKIIILIGSITQVKDFAQCYTITMNERNIKNPNHA